MSYGTESEYRAALVAYRALHDVFYRFYKRLQSIHTPDGIADGRRDLAAMIGTLMPPLSESYLGPPMHVERLAETLQELSAAHAMSKNTTFDDRLAYQAYVDVDNILRELLRHRQQFPATFDDVMADEANGGTLKPRQG
jgi:hypothetical protein